MADLKSLREERSRLVVEARALNDEATKAGGVMDAETQAKFDAIMDRQDELRSKIEREERLRDLERQTAAAEEAATPNASKPADKGDAMDGFRSWLRHGTASGAAAEEFRALSAGVNTEGGYLVAPEQFVNQLIKFVDDAVFVRGLATVYQVPQAAKLGAPVLTADPADGDWTTELQTGSEDSTMAFGKRELFPHPLAKRIKVSRQLLRQSVMATDSMIAQRMAYKFAITQEKAYLTGNGSGQPLGLFTASSDGIPTSRDVATGNTTTAFTADGLINAKYSVKGPYQASGVWMFHRDAVKALAKLKTGDGDYLWRQGLVEGEPDRLLGRPVYMSEYVPNTFTTGQYVGLFGDLSNYWIVDALQMQMQRLEELYAESNQVGFIARYEGDGAPVLAEAFARVTLA